VQVADIENAIETRHHHVHVRLRARAGSVRGARVEGLAHAV
jgi:hypothetical protein